MSKISETRSYNDEIATAPMADIAFLLIVFFMVTMTFAASRGLDFPLPPDEPSQAVELVESVLIRVHGSGALEVDGRPMALEGVLDYLGPKLRMNPMKPVIVAPEPDAAYGQFIAVYDLLRLAPERLGLERPVQIALPDKSFALYGL